jgi:site-specific DNA-methyltransferase (adenine-specific)
MIASNPLLSHLVSNAVDQAGFERRGEIVRLVQTMRGGDRPKNAHEEFDEVTVMPRSMWEPWLLFRKPIEGRVQDNLRKWGTGGLRRPSQERPFGDVIQSSPTRAIERRLAQHPSLKPQALLRQLVRGVLPLGEGIVLDPFAGSGSTLAAAEAVGYQSIGVEIDEAYVELAKRAIPMLSSLSVRQPFLAGDGPCATGGAGVAEWLLATRNVTITADAGGRWAPVRSRQTKRPEHSGGQPHDTGTN